MDEIRRMSARVDKGATVALHRAMARKHMDRLKGMGVQVKKDVSEISDDYFEARACNDLSDKSSKVVTKDVETRSVSTSLYNDEQQVAELFGIDHTSYETRVAKPHREAFQLRGAAMLDKRDVEIRRMVNNGFNARQVAIAMDIYEQRALDPATDTGQVGIDYLHEPYRQLRLAGQLAPAMQSVDIPAGYRQYTAPNLNDARFVLEPVNTTDAYTVNTSEDPANGSQTWTPVKFQAVIFWNDEFQEDALYNVEAALRGSIVRGAAIALDAALLNGDTTNTSGANINASGGSLTLGTLDPRVAFNGLRGLFYRGTHGGKSADTFTGGISGGGNAATLTDAYDVLKGMGKYASPSQQMNLCGVCSTQTYWNLRDDSRGSNFGQDTINADVFDLDWKVLANSTATHTASSNVPTDDLGVFEGCPVNLTTAGVYDNSTKTESTFLIFNKVNFLLAWKRQLQIRVVELGLGEQRAITAGFRCDFDEIIANETAIEVAYSVR